MVDLRPNTLRTPERGRALRAIADVCRTASTIRSAPPAVRQREAKSGPHEAFDLGFGPGERLLHRLALHEPHDHLGLDRLVINLVRDLRWGGGCCNGQRLMFVRVGIVVE